MAKQKIKESECSIMEIRRTGADAIARVKLTGERIIITNHGTPQVAIVSLSDLEKLRHDVNASTASLSAKSDQKQRTK
jgi:prevent-host-death family protein